MSISIIIMASYESKWRWWCYWDHTNTQHYATLYFRKQWLFAGCALPSETTFYKQCLIPFEEIWLQSMSGPTNSCNSSENTHGAQINKLLILESKKEATLYIYKG